MISLSSRSLRASTILVSALLLGGFACSASSNNTGDGDGNGDGDGPGDGDGNNSGGTSSSGGTGNSGGSDGTGGGEATGGGTGTGGSDGTGGEGGSTASVCPAGSESMVLNLAGKTPSAAVSGMPPAGFSGSFNLEGPVWIGDALYASEIAGDNSARIVRFVPGEPPSISIFLENAGTNGLAVNADGNLVVARQLDGSISVIDIAAPNTTATVLTGTYMDTRYNSPNDLAISSTGHIYFSDPNYQAPQPSPQAAERVYHLPPGGTASAIAGTPNKPNGVTLSLDEQTLYIVGTNGLMRYPVMTDGTVGGGSGVDDFNGGGDGMGMDCAGNLYVTNGQKIVVFDSTGTKYPTEIEVGANVTNIAFGGPNRTTMFITSLNSAALRTIEMDIPGLPY